MAALPPAHGQAAAKVGNEEGDEGVDLEVVGDGAVAGVVGGEHDLLPEEAERDGRQHVPLVLEQEQEGAEEGQVAGALLAVVEIGAVVVAAVPHALVQLAVLAGNLLLNGRLDGRVVAGVALLVLAERPLGVLVGREVAEGVCLGLEGRLGVGRDGPFPQALGLGIGVSLDILVPADGRDGGDGGGQGAPVDVAVAGASGRAGRSTEAGRRFGLAVGAGGRVCLDVDGSINGVVGLAVDTAPDWRRHVGPDTHRLPADPESLHLAKRLVRVVAAS